MDHPAGLDLMATVVSHLEYCTRHGETVYMEKDEQVLVLEKTNETWWKVVRSGEERPFYAPVTNLRSHLVPRVRLRPGAVRDRRRAPLSTADAERHLGQQYDVTSWESSALQEGRCGPAPVPHVLETPLRQLDDSWAEYSHTSGSYFYNSETGVSRWRPPELQPPPELGEDDLSSCDSLDDSDASDGGPSLLDAELPLPDGWRRRRDSLGEPCFVRDTSPTRWYGCVDADERVYFFPEGSSESHWALPAAPDDWALHGHRLRMLERRPEGRTVGS
ncbi:uncharacterized protein LOC119109265 [Pollicipes pollicipes]|uniref:uncharacterized protein LOC119109265 n=1 Tax=Pollicipes pollicipes TaxID=41117 RepID=UPI0018857D75|nr:uncharacterized protein LOC119109265 [Pollicipes pollicipes]